MCECVYEYMFKHGSRSICILSGFIWETSAKCLNPKQPESFTEAARSLEAFFAKNSTLQVFSHFKEVVADRVSGGFFLNCVFSIFTFTQTQICEVLKLLNKSNIYNCSAC